MGYKGQERLAGWGELRGRSRDRSDARTDRKKEREHAEG